MKAQTAYKIKIRDENQYKKSKVHAMICIQTMYTHMYKEMTFMNLLVTKIQFINLPCIYYDYEFNHNLYLASKINSYITNPMNHFHHTFE